ncbi:glutamate 5-kinase [Ectobacillus ponti]|uniref:Glutamate 5-kinase n=1 Tax=Ectobacillus ponti TaxID=2961894 RepID=A0AA41XB39_9BACI|nr:glutamate 5-kinase [Ectobacillus ponti]MCP8969608.1 glutamate 5-kinase [Ectobacillus ponti]
MKKQRIVVKIGSSSLTGECGGIDHEKLADHVEAMAALRKEGHEVVLVSSGAVAAGFVELGYSSRPVTIKGKQAAAAIGQGFLMRAYMEHFAKHGIKPAQILLTRQDFANKTSYSNAYDTLSELLERGILPVINENDTVSVAELTFGDNDMLSALVSGLVRADRLIILTDINGLYDDNPKKNPAAKRIDYLRKVTEEMLGKAGDSGSKVGTGGMKSKLYAAQTALSLGVPVFIGTGKGEAKLLQVLQGEGDGTYVGDEAAMPLNKRKQWILFHSRVQGRLVVDGGAEEALRTGGKSLLPAGVVAAEGNFQAGEVVEVFGPSGYLGKGQVSYSWTELQEQRKREGTTYTVIHRDNWASAGGREEHE